MKQTFHLIPRHETPRERMNRMKEKRKIRKLKLYGKETLTEQSQSSFPIKQDKTQIQKLKNRQAAQKSREQKKHYINQLQNQIRELKQKLANSRFCQNCQKQLSNQMQFQIEPSNSREPEQETESSFVRVSSTNEDSSIGIYLFIAMICIGVFCFGGSMMDTDNGPMRRDLTQLYSDYIYQTPVVLSQGSKQPQELVSNANTDTQIYTESNKYEQGLKSTFSTYPERNDYTPTSKELVLCEQFYGKDWQDHQQFEQIIHSYENYRLLELGDKNLRSKQNFIENNKSLLFCSRPRIYKTNPNQEGILTTFIDIFVKGAEIMNLLRTSQEPQLVVPVELEGLYKITAQIEDITAFSSPNIVY